MSVALVIIHEDGQLVYANQQAQRLMPQVLTQFGVNLTNWLNQMVPELKVGTTGAIDPDLWARAWVWRMETEDCQVLTYRLVPQIIPHYHLLVIQPEGGCGNQVPESLPLPTATTLNPPPEWDLTQLHSTALNACANAVVITDKTGIMLWVNSAFSELTGYSPAEAIGRTPGDLLNSKHHDAEFFRHLWETILAGQVWRGEIVNRHKDGHLYREAMSITPVLDRQQQITHFIAVKQDITQTQTLARALQISQAELQDMARRLSLATESAQLGIWDLDLQTQIMGWDSRMAQLYGVEADALLQTYGQWLERLHPDDRPQVDALVQHTIEQGKGFHAEFRVYWPNGQTRFIEAYGNRVQDQAGTGQRLIGVNWDITPRKQTELQLLQSEELFRNLTANLPGAVFRYVLHTDGSDAVIYMGPGCHDVWEVEVAAVQDNAQILWDLVHPEDLAAMVASVHQSAQTLQPWNYEWRITTPSGQHKWLQGVGQPHREINGDVVWDSLILDISDRKQAEAALRESEAHKQALIDAIPDLMFVVSADGMLQAITCSDTVPTLVPDAINPVGKHLVDCIPTDIAALHLERIKLAISTSHMQVGEQRISTPDGVRYEEVRAVPLGQDRVLFLVRDISQRKQIETELRQSRQQYKDLINSIDSIVWECELPSFRFTFISHQAEALLGYPVDDWLNDSLFWENHLHPEDRDWVIDYCLTQIRHGQDHDFEYRIIAADNRTVWLRDLVTVVTDDLGQPIKLRGLMIDISHSKQLELNLQHQAERERLLNKLTSRVRQSLNLEDILATAVTEARQALITDRVLVYRFDANYQRGTVAAEAVGQDWQSLLGRVITDSCFAKASCVTPYLQGHIQIIPNLHTAHLAPCYKSLLQQQQVQATLVLPLVQGKRLWGLLIAHHCSTPRLWQPEDINLMQQLSDQLEIAIQQAELYQKVQIELAERVRLEEQIRHDALHDALTGLPNRTLFLDRLAFALQRFQRWSQDSGNRPVALMGTPKTELIEPNLHQFAVLFLDLDRFKLINDSLGHATGDRLLKIASQRILSSLRDVDTAARLGGDEFVVLLEEVNSLSAALDVVQRLQAKLTAPIKLDNHEIFVQASLGIVLSSQAYSEPNQVLRDAEIAMYQAKNSDQTYAVFDAPMHGAALAQMQLENDLRRALDRQEFRLCYQPIVALETLEIEGFEALIRWHHPERGLISPLDFIPVAEETGLITAIDLWALRTACYQLQYWYQEFPNLQPLTVNVNLSGKQFARPDFLAQIDQILAETGLDGRHLKLEITESILIQNAQLAIDLLKQLQARQIQVCMDDFGTGYSSLNYLHRFPIDVLKIDKSFIDHLEESQPFQDDFAIVNAIINLALNLNLEVVAEGIETAEQMTYLRQHRCLYGQGYYFSRPLDVSAVSDLIRHRSCFYPPPQPADMVQGVLGCHSDGPNSGDPSSPETVLDLSIVKSRSGTGTASAADKL